MLFQLARQEVALRNLELLGLRIAGQLDHLEPVPQGRMHWLQPIGRRQEQHPRKIEWQIQVVIGERVVLRRIEYFQQRRRRVAAEIRAHLVQFVEHEDRVVGAGLFHPLDDASRQRPHVGPPMPSNLRLVPHPP